MDGNISQIVNINSPFGKVSFWSHSSWAVFVKSNHVMQDLIISLHLHFQSLLEFEFPWSQFNNFLLPWVVALRQRTNSSLPIVSNCNFQHEWMSPLTKYRMRLQHGCQNDLWTQTLPALTKSTICEFLKKQSHAKISLSLQVPQPLPKSCVFCPSAQCSRC